MQSPLKEFLAALSGSFEQWHDGAGYPLELVPRLSAEEKEQLGKLLRQRLAGGGGWRDVEALAAVAGREALGAYLSHPVGEVRRYAGRATRGLPEEEVLEALATVRAMENLDGTIAMVVERNTPRVRRAMLEQVQRHPDPVVRVNLAAALWHLCGRSAEVFDMGEREFFLQFGEGEAARREAAEERLRRVVEGATGMAAPRGNED